MVSISEVPGILAAIAKRAEDAAGPVALGMADAYRDRVANVTLKHSAHDRYSKTPAPPGTPPSQVSGALAASMTAEPGPSGGGIGRASASPHTVYDAVQEYGRDIYVRNRRALMWRTSYITDATNFEKSFREGAGLWLNFARMVHIPARSYLRSTRDEMIADGSLHRDAMRIFYGIVDW